MIYQKTPLAGDIGTGGLAVAAVVMVAWFLAIEVRDDVHGGAVMCHMLTHGYMCVSSQFTA